MTIAVYATNLADIFTDGGTGTWAAIGTGGAALSQETDYFIQGTSCLSKGAFASAVKGMIHDNSGDAGGSGTDGAYIAWMSHTAPNSLAAKSSGGMMFLIGDGTGDYNRFYVGGADTMTFLKWVLVAVNENATPDAVTGAPAAGVESFFGGLWNLPSGGPTKGAPNVIDAIRFGRCDIIIEFGTGADPEANFAGILANLETASLRYGLIVQREPGGAFENSGLLQFGTASNAVEFLDADKTIFLRDHDHVTVNFHTWEVQNASSIITFTNLIMQALGTTSPGRWVTTDNAVMLWTTCSFIGMGTFGFLSNATIDRCSFLRCGQITHGGATMNGSIIAGYEGAANTSAMIYDETADPNGETDDMSFTKGSAATHAIEFGLNSPLSITLTDVLFSGYNASNGNDDSTLHIKRTSGVVDITITGGDIPSYRTDGATVNIIAGAVNATVTVLDLRDGSPIEGANVLVEASSGAGPFPFEESVAIVQSGGIATVTHATHGMATNDKVLIDGANEEPYNGVKQITVTGVSEYTYPIDSGTSSPATGTIISTYVAISGFTDSLGVITMSRVFSTDQPITGTAKQKSYSPVFKDGSIVGAIDSADGFVTTVQLVLDE